MVLVSALLACSLPQPVAEASLTYDGAPVALEACSFGCGEYPCGGDIADLHGDDLDSFTARITGAYVRLWDDVDGVGGAYYDGDCVESHEETIYDAGGVAVVTTVCDREDDLDLPACWTGALEFTHRRPRARSTACTPRSTPRWTARRAGTRSPAP